MAVIDLGPVWQQLTDGTTSVVASAEDPVLLYTGANAPAVNEPGEYFSRERIKVGSPTKAWWRTWNSRPCKAVIITQ